MASSLDDEFARFEAELRSLEQEQQSASAAAPDATTSTDAASKKRPRDADDAAPVDDEPIRKKADVAAAPVVVRAAAPKIYMAPPRPAPVKKAYEPMAAAASVTTSADSIAATTVSAAPFRPGVPNTVEEVAARRGALSGFPPGVSGEYAAREVMAPSRQPQVVLPRFDIATGQYISVEEQHMMNQQQSVYEYDPNRPLTSSAAGQDGVGGAAAKGGKKPKKLLRVAGGEMWEDKTLADWPENDFRLFCGDLGNEVSDEVLAHSFSRYASFQRARVVRDKYTHKSKGYGFVSFADPFDCAKALREMNGKYIGNRPVKLTKSKWQDRNIDVAKKKGKKKNRHLFT